jgi:hypothetical protein
MVQTEPEKFDFIKFLELQKVPERPLSSFEKTLQLVSSFSSEMVVSKKDIE